MASTKQSLTSNSSDDLSVKMRNIFQDYQQDGGNTVPSNNVVDTCDLEDPSHLSNQDATIQKLIQHIVLTTEMVQTKSKGVKTNQPISRFEYSECLWTFSGSFTIIFLLCFLSTNITLWNDHGHAFPLGEENMERIKSCHVLL